MKRKAKRIDPTVAKSPRGNTEIAVQNNSGFGASMPPSFTNIEIYFDQKGEWEVARDFYNEHETRQWKNETGQPITNWKVCAADWIYNHRQGRKMRFRKSPFYSESS